MSGDKCILIFNFLQSGWASRWRVCYQRGLPRLVFQVIPLQPIVYHIFVLDFEQCSGCRLLSFNASPTEIILFETHFRLDKNMQEHMTPET